MRITPAWWQKPETVLPFDRSDFDLDDTLKGILDINPIAASMATFAEVLSRVVPDEILRKSIINNEGHSLKFVTDEIRIAVADVLFAMKNPHKTHDSGRVGQVQVDALRRVQGLNEKTDISVERIGGSTSTRGSAKDLPVSSADIDRILGDDSPPKITDSGAFRTLKPEAPKKDGGNIFETRQVRSSDLIAHLKKLDEQKKKDAQDGAQ